MGSRGEVTTAERWLERAHPQLLMRTKRGGANMVGETLTRANIAVSILGHVPGWE